MTEVILPFIWYVIDKPQYVDHKLLEPEDAVWLIFHSDRSLLLANIHGSLQHCNKVPYRKHHFTTSCTHLFPRMKWRIYINIIFSTSHLFQVDINFHALTGSHASYKLAWLQCTLPGMQ